MSDSWEGEPSVSERHHTVGPHRAWCLTCSEWCYPNDQMRCPCCQEARGLECLWVDPKVGPPERAILQDLIAELRDGVDSDLLGPDSQVLLTQLADRAEARLKEIQGE